jgi:Fe-S-cluster containining protein
MANIPFYASGLKFSCKRCSSCCRYESGFVFLSKKDLEKITSRTKMDNNSFIGAYCRWVADWNGKEVLSLKEKHNKDCIFWDSGCMIYSARPLQCVTFPFWESVVSSQHSWEAAASGCPGINTGKLHSGAEIGQYLELRTSEPILDRGNEL